MRVRLQTHCSESDWQHQYALERFRTTDTNALAGFGLIRPNTILAHGDHLADADRPCGRFDCERCNWHGDGDGDAERSLYAAQLGR